MSDNPYSIPYDLELFGFDPYYVAPQEAEGEVRPIIYGTEIRSCQDCQVSWNYLKEGGRCWNCGTLGDMGDAS